MKRIIYLILFCSLCGFSVPSAFSAQTGAAFLKIGVGARPLGMGGGYIALADDVNAIYWNPGALARLTKREISAMHTEWIDDLKYEFIGYAHPLRKGTLAGSIVYLRMGEMEKRDENRKLLDGTFTAYDLAGTISYSRFINQKTSVGVSLKMIHQAIENETAKGFAFDLGLSQKTKIENLALGLAIQNLGPKMKFINEGYNLPLTVSCGMAYKIFGISSLGLSITRRIFEKETEVGFGMEHWLANVLALRGRYNVLGFGNKPNDVSKFGFGLGFKLSSHQIDYSFLPYTDFGNTHRLSFSTKF